jgi:transposase
VIEARLADLRDLSPAFIKGTTEHLPQAEITFDKFHTVKIVNDAVDEVRREEQKETGTEADSLRLAQERDQPLHRPTRNHLAPRPQQPQDRPRLPDPADLPGVLPAAITQRR